MPRTCSRALPATRRTRACGTWPTDRWSVDGLLEANRADVDAGREEGLNEALLDRLTLTEARMGEMAKGVREIADLDDPVGEVIEGWTLENGLEVAKKRVPIGVVAVVYEARPNVTIDAAALCLKSGNAAVLRGSSSAESSNAFLAGLIADALAAAELPAASVSLLSGGGHEQLAELATQEGLVDLIIPRGGEGLKNALKRSPRCRSCTRPRGTATSTCTRTRIWRWPSGWRTTRRCSGRASATRPRRCSSIATWPRSCSPACWPS